MKIVEIEKNPEFILNTAENISLALVDKTNNYDVVLAMIMPREKMALHKHNRPNDGDEIFLFYKGGEFEVTNNDEIKKIRTTRPVLIRFKSKEPHSIINLSSTPLSFFAFYVPFFEPGEVQEINSG